MRVWLDAERESEREHICLCKVKNRRKPTKSSICGAGNVCHHPATVLIPAAKC